MNYVVRVQKNGGALEYFRATHEGERFSTVANAHGDLTISRWNIGDPFEIHHTVAILAAGHWTRVDEGFESQDPTTGVEGRLDTPTSDKP